MGVIWEGIDTRLERPVAIKLLHPHLATDPRFRERFAREARAAAGLSHPNIVAVYDVGIDAETEAPFIVMELVRGESLTDRVRRTGQLPEAQVRAIGAAIADALDYAHRRGVIHRDVKPQNVLLEPAGRPRLTDFGIAQALTASGLTQTGFVMGSVHYLAPELARGQLATGRSDVYSLGVVLYEIATGRLPFAGDTDLAVVLAHVEQSPPSPRTINARISPELDRIILRALARSPTDRYASAAELARALRETPNQRPTTRLAAGAVAPTSTVALPRAPADGKRVPPSPSATRRKVGPPPQRRGSGVGMLVLLLVLAVALVALGVGFFGLATWSRFGLPGFGFGPPSASPVPSAAATPARTAAVGVASPAATATATPRPPTRTAVGSATPTATSTATPTPSPSPSSTPAPPPSATPVPPTPTVRATPTPRLVIVPAVVGLALDDAVAQLRANGLGATVQGVNVAGEPNTVLAQSLTPGTAVVPGSPSATIVLQVPTGQVAVPDVIGKPRDEALRELYAAGFNVPVVRERRDGSQPAGAALATNPRAGKVVARGSGVELTINAAR
jgi:serine/threonine-protein kinase